MHDTLLSLKKNCETLAHEFKIPQFDVYGILKEESSASTKEGKPFGLNASQKSAVTLRVWNTHSQIGVISTSNLTPEGLKTAFEMALEAAAFWDKETLYELSPRCLEALLKDKLAKEGGDVSIQQLASACAQGEDLILKTDACINSVPYNKAGQSVVESFYFNSLNALRSQHTSSAYCYFYPLAQQDDRIPRQMGHVEMNTHFSRLDVAGCAAHAVEKTLNHLAYEKVVTGKYTVVFSPEAFLDLVNSFSNFFNAQNILDQKSLCTQESLHTQISAPFLNITDVPLDEGNVGKRFFDEEGTPTGAWPLVENGVLKNLIHTSFTAKKFNCEPTGHTNLGSKLTASAHFLKIFSSENTAQNAPILNEPYIYIEEVKALHAGINALQGSFSLPFDGFVVSPEKKVSVESGTVAGDFMELLKNIVFISHTTKLTPAGICPEVWVKDLSVTGN